jgi:hypothetical protein
MTPQWQLPLLPWLLIDSTEGDQRKGKKETAIVLLGTACHTQQHGRRTTISARGSTIKAARTMVKLLHVGLVSCLSRLVSPVIQFFSPFLTTGTNQLGTAEHKSQLILTTEQMGREVKKNIWNKHLL